LVIETGHDRLSPYTSLSRNVAVPATQEIML
jgi:hypothetical protein